MIKKIALISDIHGNLPAFNKILSDIKKLDISSIIIAGDIITDCPDSNEILNIIKKMDSTVIKGNREQYFLDHKKGLKNEWNNIKQTSSLIWSFNRISSENYEYINQLQQEAVITYGKYKIRVVHCSPGSISEEIFPVNKKERFTEIMNNLKEDILICGHSHKQWNYKIGTKTAVNPGSAGVHFNKKQGAEYSILKIGNKKVSIEHKQLPYSLKELEIRFYKSGLYKNSPLWSDALINSIKEGENLYLKLLTYADRLMEKKGIKNVSTIPDEIWDQAGIEYLF